ncbi:MAG: DNA internalization-related competence protein ComEC/Rec2 [bacterium]
MSRKPFVPILVFYILGISINNLPYSYPFLLVSIPLFFIFLSLKNKTSFVFLYLSIIFFGSFSCKLHSYKGAFNIANYVGEKGNLIGVIIDYPMRYPERTYLVLKAEFFNGKKADGLISVSVKPSNLSLSDKLFIPDIKIKEPKEYKNPGRYNKKKVLARRGIYCSAWADNVVVLGKGKINPLLLLAGKIKKRAEEILSLFPPEERGFLLGIILGERVGISDCLNKAFADTGTIHILSVSGLHLALLFGFLVIVFGNIGIKKPYKFIFSLPFLFLFCLITGSSTPTVRSLIMICVFIFSFIFERESNAYNTLAIAAFIILLKNPYELYDIGFQLSFVACLSLIYLTPRLIIRKNKLFLFISSCISASIGIAPLVLFWFSRVSLISPLSNFIVIPLVGVLLPFGLIFIFLGFINLYLANLFVLPLFLLTNLTIKAVLYFSYIPASSISLPSPGIPIVIFLYFFIFVFANRIKALFIPTLVIINLMLLYNVLKTPVFEATFLDVGLGDSIFIRSPKGCNILIDGGPPGMGRSCVLPFLRYRGIDRIDAIFATHSDADHIGGLIDCLTELKVGRVFYNGLDCSSKTYQDFKAVIKEKGFSLQRLKMGNKIKGLDLDIEVLNPPEEMFSDDNNNSLVLKVSSKDLSFLLPGDIEKEAITDISKYYKEGLNSTILKSPHHGRNKIPEKFLSLVKPEVIIAEGWDAISEDIISTNEYGAITIKSSKNAFKIETYLK